MGQNAQSVWPCWRIALINVDDIVGQLAFLTTLVKLGTEVSRDTQTLSDVAACFCALPQGDNFAGLTPDMSSQTARKVRTELVPATMTVLGKLRNLQKVDEVKRKDMMRDKMDALDKMFTEVEQIGRMIHLISLNASVEAAGAGGESGRSFKVIAHEIRSLAQQSAELIEITKDAMTGTTAEDFVQVSVA